MKMKNNSNSNNNKIMVARALLVDPNLPQWVWQNCSHSLSITGAEVTFFNDSNTSSSTFQCGGAGSVSGGTKMNHSFVVLPKQQKNESSSARCSYSDNPILSGGKTGAGGDMEESFVVLHPPSASVYNSDPTHLPSSITGLTSAFEIATTQAQVEQPLCLECMRFLSYKLDKEVEDVNSDITAYDACLQHLEGEPRNVLTKADFFRERRKIEEEERKLEASIQETEKQHSEVTGELKELELQSSRFKELEER